MGKRFEYTEDKIAALPDDSPFKGRLVARQEESDAKLELFLHHLAKCGVVVEAARLAGYADSTYIRHRRGNDKEFAKRYAIAMEDFMDDFEGEVIRRARDGVLKPKYYHDQLIGFTKEYSDTLAVKVLEAHRPEYRPRQELQHVHTGAVGVVLLPTAVSVEQWGQLAQEVRAKQIELRPEDVVEIKDVTPKQIERS